MDHEILKRRREAGDLICSYAKALQEAKGVSFKEALAEIRKERPKLYNQYLGQEAR